jgi:hypothetical protein
MHPHRHHQDIFGAGQRRACSTRTTLLSASHHVWSGVPGPFHCHRWICGTPLSLPSPVSKWHHAFYTVSVASALVAIYHLGLWDSSLLPPSLPTAPSGNTSGCRTHQQAPGPRFWTPPMSVSEGEDCDVMYHLRLCASLLVSAPSFSRPPPPGPLDRLLLGKGTWSPAAERRRYFGLLNFCFDLLARTFLRR